MLLTASSVGEHLVERGVVPAHTEVAAVELGGGVSNVVLGVEADSRQFVVKQALSRLRVADEWLAKRERAVTEAVALDVAGRVTPDAVPAVHDVDPATCVIVIDRAPADWVDWKQNLLVGQVDLEVAARLGYLLATWHGLDASTMSALDDPEAFEQLRTDPYYRTVARRIPELAPAIDALLGRMAGTPRCFVHGDFSPKNVLVGRDGLWVIDFEVAHLGDPAFDVAFLTTHLILKAVHRAAERTAYARAAEQFWGAYLADATDLPGGTSHVLQHVGALLVARVDGKSPAEYLTSPEGTLVRRLGRGLLTEPARSLDEVWMRLAEAGG